MSNISENDTYVQSGLKRLYKITPEGLKFCYKDWGEITSEELFQHMRDVMGLTAIKNENGPTWEINIIREIESIISWSIIDSGEFSEVREFFEELIQGPCFLIGHINCDEFKILIDNQLNYYAVRNSEVWLCGQGFEDFLNCMVGRRTMMQLRK